MGKEKTWHSRVEMWGRKSNTPSGANRGQSANQPPRPQTTQAVIPSAATTAQTQARPQGLPKKFVLGIGQGQTQGPNRPFGSSLLSQGTRQGGRRTRRHKKSKKSKKSQKSRKH